MQKSKFLFIYVTAVTLGQGHQKSSSTFSQTYTFFVPNIWALAQTVLTWEAKVIAAAADAAAETNWKHSHPRLGWLHKVTQTWGDLMMTQLSENYIWWVNSLWLIDVIWQHRFGSTLTQVMACCLMAPSHYLIQCWLIIMYIYICVSKLNIWIMPQWYIIRANELTHWGRDMRW